MVLMSSHLKTQYNCRYFSHIKACENTLITVKCLGLAQSYSKVQTITWNLCKVVELSCVNIYSRIVF